MGFNGGFIKKSFIGTRVVGYPALYVRSTGLPEKPGRSPGLVLNSAGIRYDSWAVSRLHRGHDSYEEINDAGGAAI